MRSNPSPNARGFKAIPSEADKDPQLDRTAVGVLTYLLGVDGAATVTLDGMRESARDSKIKDLKGAPTLLRLIEGWRETRRIVRSLAMLEAAGYVLLERAGDRVEVLEAYETPNGVLNLGPLEPGATIDLPPGVRGATWSE